MKKILITFALPKEGKIAKEFYKNYQINGYSFYFLELGVGVHNSILRLSQKLAEEKYDFVVNYGVCGYKDIKLPCLQITRSLHSASGKELITPIFFKFAPLSSCLCSDTVVYDPDILGDVSYVDMESYGVEKVCDHFRIPRLILKVPIDKVGEETKNFNIPQACKHLEENIAFKHLSENIVQYLESLQEKPMLEKYKQHFRFSVSENIIFEKYFHAYSSLSDITFDTFYKKHMQQEKKEFLKELRDHINSLRSLIG